MYIPDETVDEVLRRCDIVELIGGYVQLKKKGSNYFGLCPFHNEKTGSFSVSAQKQMFHCFGCGVSGSAYTFLMKYENFTFPEAVRFLAEKEGVVIPEGQDSEEAKRRESRRKQLLDVLNDAEIYFYRSLRDPRGAAGLKYLQDRGLSEETIKHFGLGYASKNSKEVIGFLKSKGHTDEMIKAVGLADHNEKYGLTGKFWNRVMFPIQDTNHRVIGFGGRVMGEGEPKYLNSPETEIFNKRNHLYGLNHARTSKAPNLILCEGYMDVISLHQAGFTQAVASLGTAFTQQQAALIRRYSDQVILSYDSDEAGIKACLRAIGILRQEKMTGRVLDLKPYKDPDEFIKNLGREKFQKRLDQAENGFFFEVRMAERQFKLSDPDEKTKFHGQIAQKLCGFRDDIQRENYLQAIAEKYMINPTVLSEAVRKYAAAGVGEEEREYQPRQPKPLPGGKMQIQKVRDEKLRRSSKLVLGWLLQQPKLLGKIENYLRPEDFYPDDLKEAAQFIFTCIKEEKNLSPPEMISRFEDDEMQQLMGEIFHAREDAVAGFLPEGEEGKASDVDQKVFREALLHVKTEACSRLPEDVPLGEVMRSRKEIEELKKLKIEM
ncbi:MAG: DNA primase [Lachnospiraceae bacterium]|nr:DNA primase [Lachnospiraceae bacterium]